MEKKEHVARLLLFPATILKVEKFVAARCSSGVGSVRHSHATFVDHFECADNDKTAFSRTFSLSAIFCV